MSASADPVGDSERLFDKALDAIRTPPADEGLDTLLDLARPLLAGLVAELHSAVAQDLNGYEHLHQVRIIGKRLRYAMEVFAECFPAPFREELYPAVEEMQEILGRANDSHVARQRLAALRDSLSAASPAEWEQVRREVGSLLLSHQRRLPRERRHFLDWWGRWTESRAAEMFADYLNTALPTAPG
jgi:CHAD domain-containing protein